MRGGNPQGLHKAAFRNYWTCWRLYVSFSFLSIHHHSRHENTSNIVQEFSELSPIFIVLAIIERSGLVGARLPAVALAQAGAQ